MKICDIIQEEIKNLKVPISSKSEYNLSVNKGDRMKEQIITHYLSEMEDPRIQPILTMRDDVLFLTKTDSKTYLNEFLKGIGNRDDLIFDKLSDTLREMEIWKVAFDVDSIKEQNRYFEYLRRHYWVPKDIINVGTTNKPYLIVVFMAFEMSYKS
jgi:hypothetical protein